MILYTIMPEQIVYPVDGVDYTKQRTVVVNNIEMVVENMAGNEYEVVRVLSTDPQHYLMYVPGQRLMMSTETK
jgi:YlzJ-like protein